MTMKNLRAVCLTDFRGGSSVLGCDLSCVYGRPLLGPLLLAVKVITVVQGPLGGLCTSVEKRLV